MRMSKRQYRIGELAKRLKVKKFVIRFWEKELDIKPDRSPGGQRFYEEKDFETFKLVKTLLYEKKYTIAGAKKELNKLIKQHKKIVASQKTDMNFSNEQTNISEQIQENLLHIRGQLVKLKELL